jgi:GNAT superfamily N-acetyltransferase
VRADCLQETIINGISLQKGLEHNFRSRSLIMTIQEFSVKRDDNLEDTFEIRYRTTEDYKNVLDLYQNIPDEELDYFITDMKNPDVLAQWLKPNELIETIALVAVTNDQIIGEAILVRQKASRTSHVGTLRFFIQPEWRKHGIGTVLVSSLLTESMKIGIEKLSIYIPEIADKKFKSILQKTGFSKEAVLKDHFRTRSGAKQDVIVYGRDLDELWNRISDWVGNYGRAMEY